MGRPVRDRSAHPIAVFRGRHGTTSVGPRPDADGREDDADRRIKRVSLSAQGRRQISQFIAAKRGRALEALERLHPEDRVHLLAAFTPILAKLGATETCFPQ